MNNEPFFTNDQEGLLRIVGIVAGWTITCLGLLWRFLTKPIVDRLDTLEKHRAALEEEDLPRIDILERDALLMKSDLRGLDESFGEHKVELKELRDEQKGMVTMISTINTNVEILLDRAKQRRAGEKQ